MQAAAQAAATAASPAEIVEAAQAACDSIKDASPDKQAAMAVLASIQTAAEAPDSNLGSVNNVVQAVQAATKKPNATPQSIAYAGIGTDTTRVLESLKEPLQEINENLRDSMEDLSSNIKSGIEQGQSNIAVTPDNTQLAQDIARAMLNSMPNLTSSNREIFENMLRCLLELPWGITNALGAVAEQLSNVSPHDMASLLSLAPSDTRATLLEHLPDNQIGSVLGAITESDLRQQVREGFISDGRAVPEARPFHEEIQAYSTPKNLTAPESTPIIEQLDQFINSVNDPTAKGYFQTVSEKIKEVRDKQATEPLQAQNAAREMERALASGLQAIAASGEIKQGTSLESSFNQALLGLQSLTHQSGALAGVETSVLSKTIGSMSAEAYTQTCQNIPPSAARTAAILSGTGKQQLTQDISTNIPHQSPIEMVALCHMQGMDSSALRDHLNNNHISADQAQANLAQLRAGGTPGLDTQIRTLESYLQQAAMPSSTLTP
ncbi:MAG TPA: hypothetical protein ENN77_01125 [Candidatus Wirthbacteria bacterium]|nr:hypothetical protein [Candidatus Wirthbacteria bacterium]